MKVKILLLMFVLFCGLALVDCPIDLKGIQFFAEELLRTEPNIKESGYTSLEILKERLAKPSTCPRDQKAVAAHLGEKGGFRVESLSKKNGLSNRRRQVARHVDIPDMLVNQEGYASSFNQKNPSVCMFPDRSFITVWEDERNGDIDVFAQKCTFNGNPEGYNFEAGEENFPKDQHRPCVSIIDDTSFVVVWIDEQNFDIYGKRFTKDLLPIGEAFQINDFSNTTWSPALSAGPDGKFVVVWEDNRCGKNIYARRFDFLGNPQGSSFKVNHDNGSRSPESPKVSVGLSGNFVIVWRDFRNTDADIYAQRFDSNGTELGENILVNLDSLNEDQYTPSVSMGPNDRFMVAWVDLRHGDKAIFARSFSFDHPLDDTVLFSVSSDTSSVVQESPQIVSDTLGRFTVAWTEYTPFNPAVYAQRFDSLGRTQGERIMISNLQSTGERHTLAMSASLAGSFVVAWMDKHAGNYDILAQTVTSAGFLHGTNLFLNDDQMGANQNLPQIATRADGGFVVVWEDWRRGNSDIFLRRFDQNAQPLGDDYMVNDSMGQVYHGNPDVACCDSGGNFVVVWEDARGMFLDIYAQVFDHSGNPNGENFKVNCGGMTNNSTPGCDMSPAGNFVVTWSSTNGNTKNIYGRLFSSGAEPLDTCFRINDDTLSVNHLSPVVAMDSLGGFVVAWQDKREGDERIYLQRFLTDRTKIDTNFAVYSDRPDPVQYNVDLDLNQRGDVVVTWTEPYLFSTMIYAQRYDNSGSPIDTNIMIVDDPSASPENPKVKVTDQDHFVVAWTDYRAESSDIYFQVFLNGMPHASNRRINDGGSALQDFSDIGVWNSYLYSVWRDNRIPGLGFSIFFNRINYTETGVEDHQDNESLPANFVLYQNYPNPFNPVTRIQYTVGSKQTQPVPITLKIYNVLGRLVRTLVDEGKFAGEYQIIWNGRNEDGAELSSGIYFYQLKVKDQKVTKKMLLLK